MDEDANPLALPETPEFVVVILGAGAGRCERWAAAGIPPPEGRRRRTLDGTPVCDTSFADPVPEAAPRVAATAADSLRFGEREEDHGGEGDQRPHDPEPVGQA